MIPLLAPVLNVIMKVFVAFFGLIACVVITVIAMGIVYFMVFAIENLFYKAARRLGRNRELLR